VPNKEANNTVSPPRNNQKPTNLFCTYLALKNSTNGGPTSQEMFQMPLVFIMTMLLLTSSLTSVYAMYHMKNFNFKKMQLWLLVTVLLGLGFLGF
ncbi:hypothetical protein ACT453_46640, partial [Bacillus sp. D-CC]